MNIKKVLIWVIAIIILVQIAVGFAFYIFQYKLLFIASSLPHDYKFTFNQPFKEVFIESGKNKINGLYFDSNEQKGLIIYFHGNADNLQQWGTIANDFTEKGFDVLMVDYPTFGKSTGSLNQKSLINMGFDVYDFSKKYYPEEKLVLYGRSMGSGIASKVATQRSPGLVVLETPYVDTKKLVDFHAPRFTPTSLILALRLSNKKSIPKIKCPVILFHGTDDEIIPYEQAVELETILKDSDKLITIKNGDHRNLNEYPIYHNELKRALNKMLDHH